MIACSDGDVIKIFVKRLDNDLFKQYAKFRSGGKQIKLMKSINNYLVLLSEPSMIEVWEWYNQEKIIEKAFDYESIADFAFYKKIRDSLLLLPTSPNEIKIMAVKTLQCVRTMSFHNSFERLSCISMVDSQAQIFDKSKLVICDKNRLKIIHLSGEILAELEIENCQFIKQIERFNSDHIVILTNTGEINIIYFRFKSKIQIVARKLLEFKPLGFCVFHTSNE